MKRKSIFIAVVLAVVYLAFAGVSVLRHTDTVVTDSSLEGDRLLERLYHERKSGVQVQGSGTVTGILPDDSKGSRHQRFIVELFTGQTLLIAHNIDLAPRIEDIGRGDMVEFFGEYEWNPEGGVIHWTHRDPSGKHVPGWLEHKGQRYW